MATAADDDIADTKSLSLAHVADDWRLIAEDLSMPPYKSQLATDVDVDIADTKLLSLVQEAGD